MGGKGPRPSSSESDDWGDESWIVDCPCGVNYDDGEEMVECDECGVWVHTACCRVTKGLPTFVCDKCKIKKRLKESESEVAQLLAELPSKTVCFEERSHDKGEVYITGRQNSSEIPVKDRAHVHGISGGDPSFFVGVPQVFRRELWKYTGYVPKFLKLEYRELPEAREDVRDLLCDLPEFEAPMFLGEGQKCASVSLENGHASLLPVDMSSSREDEVRREEVNVKGEAFREKLGTSLQAITGEGKQSKHRRKQKMREDKSQHHDKRARDEGGLVEQTGKKKPRNNWDVFKSEGAKWKRVDFVPSQETDLFCKSPLSSPKNPKAMKKMAVQEFMDGGVVLCKECSKIEPLLGVMTGCISGGGSNSFCRECEKVRRRSSPLSSKQETEIVKRESGTVVIPCITGTCVSSEVRAPSKGELDYCEEGSEPARFGNEGIQAFRNGDRQENLGKCKVGNDSPTDLKKVEVGGSNLRKVGGILENLIGRDEKRRPLVKVESNALKLGHPSADIKSGQIPEALELPAARSIAAAKAPVESAGKAEELRHRGAHFVASSLGCAPDAEANTPGHASNSVCGNKQTGPVDGQGPIGSLDNWCETEQIPADCSMVTLVPGNPGSIPAEGGDENASLGTVRLQVRAMPAVFAETLNGRAGKWQASTLSMETKGQGSARTAGHLPASVRGKMHGDKCYSYLQRSVSAAVLQQQACSLSIQSPAHFSSCGTPRSVSTPVTTVVSQPLKDFVCERQPCQAQQDCISPVQQVNEPEQPSWLQISQFAQTPVAQTLSAGLSQTLSRSIPTSPSERPERDLQLLPKVQPGLEEASFFDSSLLAVSPKEPNIGTGFKFDREALKPTSSTQITPTPALCQQARQLNGMGHVYVSRKSFSNSTPKDSLGTLTSQALNSIVGNTKLSLTSLKSLSSGTSSSSPTSPLVTTPSSRSQPSVKVAESLSTQKTIIGGVGLNAFAPQLSPKLLDSKTSNVFSSKQIGSLLSSKSSPLLASPKSTKVFSTPKQLSKSNIVQAVNSVDGSDNFVKNISAVVPFRGVNHSGSSSSALVRGKVKNVTQANSKTLPKANTQLASTKHTSFGKSTHSPISMKGSALCKQPSGPGSGTYKSSSKVSSTEHTAPHHSKSVMCQKDEKSSVPHSAPVLKAMSSMLPPPPQVSTKRSPPTVLPSSMATTLKDEELALLLHQELNSSPRVPRVPRVRQAGVSLQLVSAPSVSSGKGAVVSAASGGHKDYHMTPKTRTREERLKDPWKNMSLSFEEVGRTGGRSSEENKVEDEASSEKDGDNEIVDDCSIKDKSSIRESQCVVEGNAEHHIFAKGSLSIIVPGKDESQDGDKKSPVHSSFVTLPGLIDEVLGSQVYQLSYEDVCEAVLPHWPKLRKPNGDRYAYPSHRQAVLDCLRNRPAWAHLIDRGPKTNLGRKRRRNDVKALSDSDEEKELLGFRGSDRLETSKSSKYWKASNGEGAGDTSERSKNTTAAALEDGCQSGRQVRRRRKVAIEDGTDGEDEPIHVVEKTSAGQLNVSESDDDTSQDGEPEAESSPSSDEEASNYSTEDEEMVVHRGIRNRRLPAEESSSSEGDID